MTAPQADPARVKSWLIDNARQLGFDFAGVTSPDPPPHLDVFDRWLADGNHGSMNYMSRPDTRAKRADPRQFLPDCRSILVLAMSYLPQQTAAAETAPAKVATYAVGTDYHDLITDRLQILSARLAEWLDQPIEHAIAVDSAPVLERELAQRAGLGWIGKNTCLIIPQAGSYFFLAELFLAIDLPADAPLQIDHCGSCTRCLEACPTNCILPNRTLDSRRCISYLTIEHRGAIDLAQRPDLNDWVFGCDICQQVCPWNIRFALPTDTLEFQASPDMATATPADYLELDEPAYSSRFEDSPIRRAKRAGLARNASIVAGNLRQRQAVPALIRHLHSDVSSVVRQHAAWALGQIGGRHAEEALNQARSTEGDSTVMAEIDSALAGLLS